MIQLSILQLTVGFISIAGFGVLCIILGFFLGTRSSKDYGKNAEYIMNNLAALNTHLVSLKPLDSNTYISSESRVFDDETEAFVEEANAGLMHEMFREEALREQAQVMAAKENGR